MRLQYRIDEVVAFHRLTCEHLAEIVEIQLAMKILAGDFNPGDSIRVVRAGEGLRFEVGEPLAVAA